MSKSFKNEDEYYDWSDYLFDSRWPTTCWKEGWYGNYQWYINCTAFGGMWGIDGD